jgi:8-amino-7-oxononanoate synthase
MTPSNSRQAQETVDRVRQALGQIGTRSATLPASSPTSASGPGTGFDFSTLPEYDILKIKKAVGDIAGIENPFYRLHDTRACETTSISNLTIINFSSYDYLGLNGHPRVMMAAKAAIDRYGTSVSASRLSAGDRPVHRDLEAALAALHGVESALAFVSGHATNMSAIGTLVGKEDLIITDSVIHNSVMEGAKLSGARLILCPHGDVKAVERALRLHRARYRRALIVVEGLYSMDGDMPDLAALVDLKSRYNAWLMVDEAHSIGVLGSKGGGIAEEQGVDPTQVDIWMGTLSKTLAAAGGYLAGSQSLIELMKYTCAGFVYSVGLSPPAAAASLAAINVMQRATWRLKKLRNNGRIFLAGAKKRGLNVGDTIGAAIIPVIIGDSPKAVALSQRLLARGYNVVPAIFPGVPENQARLRFFMTSRHNRAHIESVLDAVVEELRVIQQAPSFVSIVSKHVAQAPTPPAQTQIVSAGHRRLLPSEVAPSL